MKWLRRVDGWQLLGVAAIVSGVWLVFPPAALVLGGVGLVLWAEGRKGDGDGDR